MMHFIRMTLAAAVCGLSATSAQAATVGGYTSFFALGDSLSDAGNLFSVIGQPAAPYVDGRFSNGPIWADRIAARFEAQGLDTGNFAFGFANAVPDTADFIPDLPFQVANFAASNPVIGDNPLMSFWFGANDVFGAIDTSTTEFELVEKARAAATAVGDGVRLIASGYISNFLIFNLPDLGRIPSYALFQPNRASAATAATLAFNDQLALEIEALRARGYNVIAPDVYDLFNDLIESPTDFGLVDATTPCIIPGVSVCTPAESLERAFFDSVHPNTVVHAALADEVLAAIAPVPLPASGALIASLIAGMGLVAARRRSVRAIPQAV